MICLALCFACACEREEEIPPVPASSDFPELMSEYYFLVDRNTGQILLDEKSEERIYPASMTKLMTAVLALENMEDPEETFLFTEEVLAGLEEANANRAGFAPGDEPTLLDLVYGDLLPSGADCSRALAWSIAGSEEAFVQMMNDKAAELGMADTHFVNTSGLFEEDHYSTCRDIAVLMDYCMKNETFMEILGTVRHVSVPVRHYPNGLSMDNYVMVYVNQPEPGLFRYLFTIPGFLGGKSGYILESRFSLVSAASFNGMDLIFVNVNAFLEEYYPASIDDAAQVYNWVFEHISPKEISAEEISCSIAVRNSDTESVDLYPAFSLSGDYGEITLIPELPEALNAPLSAGQEGGLLHVYSYEDEIGVIPLLTASAAEKSTAGVIRTFLWELTHDHVWILTAILLSSAALLVFLITSPRRRGLARRRL